jgi:hypothetical protein
MLVDFLGRAVGKKARHVHSRYLLIGLGEDIAMPVKLSVALKESPLGMPVLQPCCCLPYR